MKRSLLMAGLSLAFLLTGCKQQPPEPPALTLKPLPSPQQQSPRRRSAADVPRPAHPLPNSPAARLSPLRHAQIVAPASVSSAQDAGVRR